jgi:ABC-type iron transport system FetAB permease component
VLLYVLLGSVSVGALTSVLLAYRNFFTRAQQLRELPA